MNSPPSPRASGSKKRPNTELYYLPDDEIEETDISALTQESQSQNNIETTSLEELLIVLVEQRPPLWDSRLPLKERSKSIREALWKEVFEQFGDQNTFDINILMKKWRNLRDTYVRLKAEYIPSGSGADRKKKKWVFFDSLSFLNESLEYRQTTSNLVSATSAKVQSIKGTSKYQSTNTKVPKSAQNEKKNAEDVILDAVKELTSSSSEMENPICLRISQLLSQMPVIPRTQLEIKLLELCLEKSAPYLNK